MFCPSCGHEQADELAECVKCQVIFSKWAERKSRPATSKDSHKPKSQHKGPIIICVAILLSTAAYFILLRDKPAYQFEARNDKNTILLEEALRREIVSIPIASVMNYDNTRVRIWLEWKNQYAMWVRVNPGWCLKGRRTPKKRCDRVTVRPVFARLGDTFVNVDAVRWDLETKRRLVYTSDRIERLPAGDPILEFLEKVSKRTSLKERAPLWNALQVAVWVLTSDPRLSDVQAESFTTPVDHAYMGAVSRINMKAHVAPSVAPIDDALDLLSQAGYDIYGFKLYRDINAVLMDAKRLLKRPDITGHYDRAAVDRIGFFRSRYEVIQLLYKILSFGKDVPLREKAFRYLAKVNAKAGGDDRVMEVLNLHVRFERDNELRWAIEDELQRAKTSLTDGLVAAAGNGRVSGVNTWLVKGANIDGVDKHGYTALTAAAIKGYIDVIEVLLAKGADVNVQNRWGQNALLAAAAYGHVEAVRILLENEAHTMMKDRKGKSALDLAREHKHKRMIKLILKAGGT